MDSLWSDEDERRFIERYAQRGVNADLARRTYSSRLLGSVPRLVMHGGGNTSVKTQIPDVFGDMIDVLCVKGSGRDLATIEPDGHPAVRRQPLDRLRSLAALSDEDMVNAQRQNLLDTGAPNPSVETLLHAYLPHKFIDHTHSITSTAIACLPDAQAVCERIFGGRIGFVPYIMPGFQLAKMAADVFERDPSVEGLLLAKHGIFTFAETARDAYELMIEMVTLMERYIVEQGTTPAALTPIDLPSDIAGPDIVLPILRGLISEAATDRAPGRWLLTRRVNARILRFVNGRGVNDYGIRGVATPEQVIRIKSRPAILPPPSASTIDGWRVAAEQAIDDFIATYDTYFEAHNQRVGGIKKPLDPLPRVLVVPGFGVVGIGKTAVEAEVSADVAEAWIDAVLDAETVGTFESITPADHFDMEYWSLEQAKLGKGAEKRLARHVVAITGGGGAIGAATAQAFAREGAEVAILDLDPARAEATRATIGGRALALGCDVTDAASVDSAMARIAAHFGGLDILVSNAGSATAGMMADMPDADLRGSFELNFFGHNVMARAAVRVMRQQGMGGVLLFNVSKQAVNPGPDFGAYGTAKAALLALVRQYALEHGAEGIRVNAVNADRIRSGLLSPAMIEARSESRGVTPAQYMAGNLLRQEVTAEDVAEAFVASALLRKTTGNVMTVDGGNVAAMMR
ncbi:bifunctional aldolase/short-chain dehydrogenase [Acidisoma cladoniae]|jgi:rhamnose utilization protein RhaD (predicted bifunctional aldolase and dehydrogenase)/NAD(P)-dependent dehydrogenase (short-subunit alcohol dehydrogenase family)|uniref:bifunctional aldolase/short-chain dehydrogenase n=1 Tax=Acidisoma cladoniae TaxID=3040935 RepID=UPI00254EC7B2|nr:bifunctional aldolase/short-chain dehydrogenase [Acidisoma sp. PAMC 29798]